MKTHATELGSAKNQLTTPISVTNFQHLFSTRFHMFSYSFYDFNHHLAICSFQ